MARFCGKIGFASTEEVDPIGRPGVFEDVVHEKTYYGDVLQNTRKWEKTDDVNDNLNISNKFSIIADKFAVENFQYIKYVNYFGANWKVTTVDIQYPRLILSVGGLYNG